MSLSDNVSRRIEDLLFRKKKLERSDDPFAEVGIKAIEDQILVLQGRTVPSASPTPNIRLWSEDEVKRHISVPGREVTLEPTETTDDTEAVFDYDFLLNSPRGEWMRNRMILFQPHQYDGPCLYVDGLNSLLHEEVVGVPYWDDGCIVYARPKWVIEALDCKMLLVVGWYRIPSHLKMETYGLLRRLREQGVTIGFPDAAPPDCDPSSPEGKFILRSIQRVLETQEQKQTQDGSKKRLGLADVCVLTDQSRFTFDADDRIRIDADDRIRINPDDFVTVASEMNVADSCLAVFGVKDDEKDAVDQFIDQFKDSCMDNCVYDAMWGIREWVYECKAAGASVDTVKELVDIIYKTKHPQEDEQDV